MTSHLSPDERIDALDGTLEVSRQAHVDACAGCRQELTALRELRAALIVNGADDVPEPSPLFWDHFESRVGAAVNEVPVPWWRGSTRAWLTLATASAIVLAVWMSPWPTRLPEDVVADAGPEMAEMAAIGESVQWQFMSGVLESLEHDDARMVLAPSAAAVDTAFESLSAVEREAFARLLQADLTEGSY